MRRNSLWLLSLIWPTFALGQNAQNLCHLVADSGGGNGGDDLATVLDLSDFNAGTNETNIGTGTGTNNIEAAAIQPGTGIFYALNENRLGRISLTTGVFTPVSGNTLGSGDGELGNINFNDADGLSFDPTTDILYAAVRRVGRDLLIQVNPNTGVRISNAFGAGIDYVPIDAFNGFNDVDDMAVDPNTGQMFAIISDGSGNGNRVVRLNKSTGAATDVGALGTSDMEGLSFDTSGNLYGVTSFGVFDINKTTGLATNPRPINNGSDYESLSCFNVDSDNDGLFDFEEEEHGTDPTDPDTDNDGLLDGIEVNGNNPTNPLNEDTDNDGLLDGIEDVDLDGSLDTGETNPNDADTDNDGLLDGEEVLFLGTDPLDTDTDGDNINDFVETDGGSLINSDNDGPIDALDTDSDNDTLPDLQEGTTDTDSDGKGNWRDSDDDNDTILTVTELVDEAIFGVDVDADGKPNHLDTDSDKDDLLDSVEGRGDRNGDGIPNYLDPSGKPLAVNDFASTNEDTSVTINVLANDTGIEDAPLVVAIVSSPANGAVVVNANNTITYTPNPNFNGANSFVYKVTDIDGQSSSATVSVTVIPVVDPVVAVDDVRAGLEDTPLSISKASLLANDLNPDGGTLTITSVNGAVNGVVSMQANSVTFFPNPNFFGVGKFTYTMTNGSSSDSALVTINIASVNDIPVANDDSLTTNEDTPLTISINALLANDTDVEGPLSLVDVSLPSSGVVSLQGSNVIYTPAPNFFGAASFVYTASDGLATDTALVNINVLPINDAPVAIDDIVASGDPSVTFEVIVNDLDVDGDSLSVLSATQGASGQVTVNPDNTITYTTTLTEITDSFEYTITDGNGGVDTATVTISIGTDLDGDGLTNDDEEDIGTDPLNPDTDGDQIKDGTEVFGENPTDPLDEDSDDDSLLDGEEDLDQSGSQEEGETDPNDADTDDGGVADGDELDNGTDPLNPEDDFPPGHYYISGGSCAVGGGSAPSLLALLLLGAILAMQRRRAR